MRFFPCASFRAYRSVRNIPRAQPSVRIFPCANFLVRIFPDPQKKIFSRIVFLERRSTGECNTQDQVTEAN